MKNILGIVIIILIMVQLKANAKEKFNDSEQFYLYVGAYTQGEDEGITIYKFDATDGDLQYISTTTGVSNPSYMVIHPKKKLLIAVNETGQFNGEESGSVSSFAISMDGSLKQLSQVASGGGSPCYVSIDKSGDWAFVSNYGGGNVSMFPIEKDGTLKPYSELMQHIGTGVLKGRQSKPFAHSVILDPKDDFALVADLGLDKVISYKLDKKNGKLESTEESNLKLADGSGPRHLTFHPNKKLAFIISELTSTISSCTYNANLGKLTLIETVNALPAGFNGESYCADIHVSPNGKFLYGSNRGHDSIVIYQIDQKTGNLTYVDHHSVNGSWPRNFMIDPSGKFLLVANQKSNNIVVFKIDSETGKLRANGVEVEISKPVCLKMLAIQ